MALSKDEQAQLDALTRKASEPDEDFSIEIWDETGAGAKVPYSKGRTWLNRFGIDLPDVEAEPEGDDKPAPKPRAVKSAPAGDEGHAAKYFGNKNRAS